MTKSPKGINRYFISASFIILLLLGQQAARGQTNQWTKLKSEGMYSAYARALVLDLHDQDVIYVGLKGGGIYKSTNGGDFWSEHNNGLLNKDILSLAIHPTNSQILYAGTEQGLFRSNDGANSWERLNFPVCHVNSIAFHPSNSDIIYAATGKLYGKGETLFGLWFSSDAGETWKKTILHDQRLPGIPGDEYFIYPFNASQGQPDRVFVGTIHGIWFDNTQNCDFGFRSHNNDLWTERVYAILANPQDPKFLYAGTLRGLRKGEIKDADSSYWADTDFMLANMSITSLAADDSFLYIGTEKRGIYKTKLSNDIWSLRNCDSITTGNIDTVYTIHASKSPNSTIYFTCSKGIFKKTGNQDFEIKNNGIKCAQINGFVFDEKNQLFYVGTQDGAYKGTKGSDNVINWNKIDGLPDKQVTVFKIDPQNSDILYAIVRSDGIYKSTNKGISWRKETSGEQNILSILITYKNNMAIVFYGSDKGLFKLGTASPIATTNAAVSVIAADPLQPETLYVGTLGNGIFKSRNCGDTWEKIKDPIISFTNINCISVSSKNPDLILCGTNQGIYKSSDAGSTWRKIEDPLVKYLKINDLCFHPRYPKVLLAASERGGIFISRDEAESWRDLNDSLENFNVLCLAATTDGQTTTFYAGTEGNSIFYLNLCDPVIQVQPQMLVFRDTDIGDSTYRSFTIKNIGQDLLTVKSISSESPIFKVSFQTQQILPNDSISIIITFKPVQPITYEGSLTIESNDPKNPQLPIKLIGKGGIPRLIVASEHDFGKVRITKPTQWIMKIKNVGTDTLKITAIESTHPDVFWADPNTNISILPDSVFSDTIIFKPNSIGSFNDTLTIKTAAWGEKKVTLLGKGVAPKMAISEHEIQLGAVKVSETIQREFALANSGEDVLSIDSMKFTMADSIFSIFPYSIKIPPSDSIKAKLTFSADTLKEYRNELLIFSDSYDGNDFQDTARISIAGTGVAPRIQVSSVGIHFPDVPAGNQLSDCLQVKNAGSYPLRFLCRGIDTTEFCANPPSGSIGINESLDIKITFKPDSEFLYQDTLFIISDDPFHGSVPIYLEGRGIKARILVNNEYNFGKITVGETSQSTIQIQNAGTDILNILWIESNLPTIFSVEPDSNIHILPGSSYPVTIKFTPTEAKEFHATLTIHTDAWGEKSILLHGEGDSSSKKDTTAPQIAHNQLIFKALKNQAIPISATITDDGSGVAVAHLLFRMGGESNFCGAKLTNSMGDLFEGFIPASSVTTRGIEYFITAKDKAGNEVPKPNKYYTIQVRTEQPGECPIDSLGYVQTGTPFGNRKIDYHLFSIPLLLDNPFNRDVLKNLGNYETDWRLFNYVNGLYYECANIFFEAGKSYWLIIKDPQKLIYSGAGESVSLADTSRFRSIPVHNCWQTFANPYNFRIPTDHLILKNDRNSALNICTYQRGWITANEIKYIDPWEGYLIKAHAEDTLFIDTDLSQDHPVPRSQSQSKPIWAIQIKAVCDSAQDTCNYAGVFDDAADAWDVHDLYEPPRMGDYVMVYFSYENWQAQCDTFTTDYRKEIKQGALWQFAIETNIKQKAIQLKFEVEGLFPPDFHAYFLDPSRQRKLDLSISQDYFYYSDKSTSSRIFHLLVGNLQYIQSADPGYITTLSSFCLLQNYPNPFNQATAIPYVLDKPSKVNLTIFNLLGERVATLMSDHLQEPGQYQANWDGLDSQKRIAPSGVYLYQLKAGNRTKIGKMILLR